MNLEIVSPEKTLFTGEVDSVSVPGTDGSFQMLNNHAPIISTLKEGKVKIVGNIKIPNDTDIFTKINDRETHLNIISGVIEMKNNQVIILTD